MKKTITTFFAFLALGLMSSNLHAQNVEFTLGGNTYGKTDTMEILMPHGFMIGAEGIGVANPSARAITLKVACIPVESSSIEVLGICTTGGQCSEGNISKSFSIEGNSTCEDFSIELNIPDDLANGYSGLFILTSMGSMDDGNPDTTGRNYTFLKITVNTASIWDATSAKHITLYPNPATDRLVVNTDEPTSNSELHIYNAKGELVMRQPIISEQQPVSVRHLANGVYFCTLISNGQTSAYGKFVVSH